MTTALTRRHDFLPVSLPWRTWTLLSPWIYRSLCPLYHRPRVDKTKQKEKRSANIILCGFNRAGQNSGRPGKPEGRDGHRTRHRAACVFWRGKTPSPSGGVRGRPRERRWTWTRHRVRTIFAEATVLCCYERDGG